MIHLESLYECRLVGLDRLGSKEARRQASHRAVSRLEEQLMLDGAALRNLIRRRLTRRPLFRAGGAGVATALTVGNDRVTVPGAAEAAALLAAPDRPASATRAATPPAPADLLALDPHALTGRTMAAP